jgi:hypothetical protein
VTRDLSPSSAPGAELAGGLLRPSDDEVDHELLSLPDPPKRGRAIAVAMLALTAVVSVCMVFALRRDVAYAFASSSAAEAGELLTVPPTALGSLENKLVSARGMLGAAGGILYERPFVADTFRALPVAGRQDLWVEVRVPAGQENGRWEPPRRFAGRLVRFDAAGPRHRGLAGAIADATHEPVPSPAWLLVDGEAPGAAVWAVALAALFLGFAGWNVFAIGRLVRRVR